MFISRHPREMVLSSHFSLDLYKELRILRQIRVKPSETLEGSFFLTPQKYQFALRDSRAAGVSLRRALIDVT